MRSISGFLAGLAERPPSGPEVGDFQACAALRAELEAREDEVGDVFEASGGTETVVVGVEARAASLTEAKARILYRLVRNLQPSTIVELGSAFGLSGAHIVRALAANDAPGALVTIEASPSRHRIAADMINRAATGFARPVVGLFEDHLDELDGADLVFIDGNHQPEPTLGYVEAAIERGRRPCTMVLDDVDDWSADFTSMWRDLLSQDRFSLWGEAAGLGLLVVGDSPALAAHRDRGLRARLAGLRGR